MVWFWFLGFLSRMYIFFFWKSYECFYKNTPRNTHQVEHVPHKVETEKGRNRWKRNKNLSFSFWWRKHNKYLSDLFQPLCRRTWFILSLFYSHQKKSSHFAAWKAPSWAEKSKRANSPASGLEVPCCTMLCSNGFVMLWSMKFICATAGMQRCCIIRWEWNYSCYHCSAIITFPLMLMVNSYFILHTLSAQFRNGQIATVDRSSNTSSIWKWQNLLGAFLQISIQSTLRHVFLSSLLIPKNWFMLVTHWCPFVNTNLVL